MTRLLKKDSNSSHVSKSAPGDKKEGEEGGKASPSTQVELLNPNFDASTGKGPAASASTGGDEEIEASPEGKKFAQIKASDYASSAQFIAQNPHILSERETDGILVMAFDAALEKKDDYARQCVHQALLLQYCRSLGRDGVGLFFKRITTKDHKAQEVFYNDVKDTYLRIRNRSREIIAERAKEEEQGGVEQIQLHAMEPGTVINIQIPPADSDDADVKKAREIFEGFAPEMRKALESANLDEVNKVLGDMKVPDAEELVNKFGEVCAPPVPFPSVSFSFSLP